MAVDPPPLGLYESTVAGLVSALAALAVCSFYLRGRCADREQHEARVEEEISAA
jgi:hypothetical protein